MAKNPSESLLAKLKNVSRETGIPMETAMRRYAYERLLALICESEYRNDFCLKGGILLGALFHSAFNRPTEDLDFNGMDSSLGIAHLAGALQDLCSRHDGRDGLSFDIPSMRVLKDRDEMRVPGGKLLMLANIGKARVRLTIDVGYGNPITPSVRKMEFPTILPSLLPPPVITVYPPETTIAEKAHAMRRHGAFNTRIKDYFDIWCLSERFEFEGEDMAAAIRNTFEAHGDTIPDEFAALGQAFSASPQAQRQWKTFTAATGFGAEKTFTEVVEEVARFLYPAIAAANGGPPPGKWTPKEGWEPPSASMRLG